VQRLAAALLLAAGSGAVAACALDLLDPANGRQLARVLLPAGRDFALLYTHSVTLRPVESRYSVLGNEIVQTAELFDEHGPGMSTEPLAGEWIETLPGDGGTRFVLHMARPMPRLVVRLHERPAFRLGVAGQKVDLDRWRTRSVELRPDCAGDRKAPP
jgi:hypothetical protein